MARTDPTVNRFVAVTDHGTEIELLLSAVVPKFELRFAAAGLLTGREPDRLIIEVQGQTAAELHRPMHRAMAERASEAVQDLVFNAGADALTQLTGRLPLARGTVMTGTYGLWCAS